MNDEALVWHIMLSVLAWTVLASIVLIIYAFALRRFDWMARPLRMALVRRGEALLAYGDLDAKQSAFVEWCLDHAFNPWIMVLSSVLGAVSGFRLILVGTHGKPPFTETDDLKAISVLFWVSAFAANPFFGFIVGLEFLLFGSILFLKGGLPLVVRLAVEAANIKLPHYHHKTRHA